MWSSTSEESYGRTTKLTPSPSPTATETSYPLGLPSPLQPSESTKNHEPTELSSKTTSNNSTQESEFWLSDMSRSSSSMPSQGAGSSWSVGLDERPGNPGSVSDRVFPIRSVVSMEPSQTPASLAARLHTGERNENFPPVAASVNGADTSNSPHRDFKQDANGKPVGSSDDIARLQLFRGNASDNSSGLNKLNGGDPGSFAGIVKSGLSCDGRPSTADSVDEIQGLVTTRFKHIVTAEGHAVITGHDGETLQSCEDEP